MSDIIIPITMFFVPFFVIHLLIILEISRFPHKLHRDKRFWSNIVLLLPIVGVFAYLIKGRSDMIKNR